MKEYMTIPELMEYIRVSRKTAYAIVARGDIPAYRLSPRKTLVAKEDAERYINTHKI